MRGELRAVITTDALELGIDIGELDAAVVVTFPGTVASLRQMWGRAGRRGRGLAVYVAGEDALDQFFCRHPEDFLERPVEAAILDHESPLIFRQHLLCAAHEGPLSRDDAEFLGPRWEAHAEVLQSAGELRRARRASDRRRHAYVPRQPRRLPGGGGLAALGLARELRDRRRLLRRAARLDRGRARALDRARGRDLPAPRAAPMRCASSTSSAAARSSRRSTATGTRSPSARPTPTIVRLLDRREALGVTLSFGEVSVTDTVLAYQRRRLADHAPVDLVALDLPPTSFATQALWFELRRGRARPRRSRWRRCSARCTPPSTRRSRCCR